MRPADARRRPHGLHERQAEAAGVRLPDDGAEAPRSAYPDQRRTLMAKRLRIQGKNFILPDGRVFYPLGTNSRFELAQVYDPPYEKSLGFTAVRIEFPWWQNGSAPEIGRGAGRGRG